MPKSQTSGRKEKWFQSTVPGATSVWENLGVCQRGDSNIKVEDGVELSDQKGEQPEGEADQSVP